MAEIQIGSSELRPLVQAIVAEVLSEMERKQLLFNGRLAVTEAEGAEYLGLNPWQLRDLRLAGKISYSRIVGGRVRYTVNELLDYLQQCRVSSHTESTHSARQS